MNRRLNDVIAGGRRAARRFLPSLIFSVLAAAFQSYFIYTQGDGSLFGRSPIVLSAVSVIGFFVSLSATLFSEQCTEGKGGEVGKFIAITAAVLTVVLSFFRLDAVPKDGADLYASWPFLLLLIASGLTVFYADALYEEHRFMRHVVATALDVLIAYIYAFVLFLGASLILLGADLLFGLHYDDTLFYVGTICFFPLMALFFLYRIPEPREMREDNRGVLFIVENLFNNILVPVMTIYGVLLYVYFAKIIVARELPTTSIVNLVLWPLALTVLVLFVVDRDRERNLTYYFRKYAPFASLPLLGLMYYAWFLRVSQYGLTENRYIVFVMGIWVTFSMVHFIVEKRELHMILPMTLTVILLVSVFGGPIGAEEMAFQSQMGRLNRLLLENRMLKGERVVSSNRLSAEDEREIAEIVSYLFANHDVSKIPYLEGRDAQSALERVFGIDAGGNSSGGILTFYLESGDGVDIRGYENLYPIETYADDEGALGEGRWRRSRGVITFSFSESGEENVVVDLKDIREKIAILKKSAKTIGVDDLALEGESGGYAYKIYFLKAEFALNEGEIRGGDGVGMAVLLRKNGGA